MIRNTYSERSDIFRFFVLPAVFILLFSFSSRSNENPLTARKPISDTNPEIASSVKSVETKTLQLDAGSPGNNPVLSSDASGAPVTTEATYPGGSKGWMFYMMHEFRYPERAQRKKIQGKVVVQFTINEKGRVSDVKALSGDPVLQTEAKRIIRNSDKWIPATENGKPVLSVKQQAISFKLEGS